jgi:hypothetical protein
LDQHASSIASLKGEAAKIVPSLDEMPYNNDVFYLRYCLDEELDSNSIARGSNGGSDVSTKWSPQNVYLSHPEHTPFRSGTELYL